MITIYSTSWCPECIITKRFLEKKGLVFTEINVADRQQDREEVLRVSGQLTVPVVDIGGTVIVGFDRQRIEQALQERPQVVEQV